MITNRFSLLFRLKKPNNYVKGPMPVYLRITIDAQRTELSVNREFDPERWNTKAGRATGTREDAKTLNAYLDTLQVKVHEAHRALIEAGEIVTAKKLKNKLLGRGTDRVRMLLDIFREHNRQMTALIQSGEYAPGTHTHFETTLKHTEAFLRWKFQAPDIPIDQIDYAFISDFEYYLKTSVCAHNTAMKYLGDFKKIVLLCVKRGWLSKDPFMGYKLSRREVQKEFLMDWELAAVAEKEFAFERLCLVRDIFLFSCYTGLAYADVRKLRRSEIRTGIDGGKWLFIQRRKSGTPAPVPLLPVALAILDRYADHPKCQRGEGVLPIFSNQKMNAYLKEIADLCGISKNLTFHTARHTFATTVTLNNNVPIESVSKMLGHKSLKQTQHYARILNKKVGEDMEVLRQKLSGVPGSNPLRRAQ